jgi:hypothetical protein
MNPHGQLEEIGGPDQSKSVTVEGLAKSLF